jgi:predicted 5'-methylthioadenosine/S-adenosylhomocysteine nucleosidase
VILVVAATPQELAGLAAETLVCGIGPVEAAAVTAHALTQRRPDAVLNVGLAGAREIAPPGIVLGSESVYHDVDDGLAQRLGVPRRIAADPALLAAARDALPDAHVVPIGTSGSVGGATWAEVEAMEGFAVLRAAQLAGVPALELRAVSNDPDEPDRAKWQFAEALAALAAATERVLAALDG